MSVTGAMVAVSVFVVWTLASDAVSRRPQKASSLISGAPAIVLRSGEPLLERLDDEHLSLDDLKEAARLQGYRDLTQIEWPSSKQTADSASSPRPSNRPTQETQTRRSRLEQRPPRAPVAGLGIKIEVFAAHVDDSGDLSVCESKDLYVDDGKLNGAYGRGTFLGGAVHLETLSATPPAHCRLGL